MINRGYVKRLKIARLVLLQVLKDKSNNNKRFHEDMIRVSGDCVCNICNEKYYDHPHDSEFEFLNIRCDGQRLKL